MKNIRKIFAMVLIATLFMIAIILLKYKPVYVVTLGEQEVGYIQSKIEFENEINNFLESKENEYVAFKTLANTPNYELKLVNYNEQTLEESILVDIKKSAKTVYTMYAIEVNNTIKSYVKSEEEAQKVVNEMQGKNEQVSVTMRQIYTEDMNEISSSDIVIAKIQDENINPILEAKAAQEAAAKKAAAKKVAKTTTTKTTTSRSSTRTAASTKTTTTELPVEKGNGVVKITCTPVSGKITSKFGERSSIRSSAHTGLDIAAPAGTPIKACNSGTVTFAGTKGSYGKLVKISHGDGVETWYAHCSSINVTVGQSVSAGEVIAGVGSTGNSTGNHLHLEIRVNGTAVNPQNYVY